MGCKSHFNFLSIKSLFIWSVIVFSIYTQNADAINSENIKPERDKDSFVYSDYIKAKEGELRNLNEKISLQVKNSKNNEEKIYNLLGLLNLSINNKANVFKDDLVFIKKIKELKGGFNSEQKEIYAYLYAKSLFKKLDYAGVVLELQTIIINSSSLFFSPASIMFLESLLNANLDYEAIDFYNKYSDILEKNMSWENLNKIHVKLAISALHENNYNLAYQFLKKPLLYFPAEQSAQNAMNLISEMECISNNTNTYYFRDESFTNNQKDLFQRIGKRQDSKNFIFALMNVNPKNLLPSESINDISFNRKLMIFNSAKMLFALREYSYANILFSYLLNSKDFDKEFSKDKILDFLGRINNSLQNPTQAADYYKELFTKFPDSELASMAKRKYAFSLNFAKKYEKAAQFAKEDKIYPEPGNQAWFIFWQYYSALNFDSAKSVAENFLSQASAKTDSLSVTRFQYWFHSIKKNGNEKNWENEMTIISQRKTDYPYPIFARMKLQKKLQYSTGKFFNQLAQIKDDYKIENNKFVKNASKHNIMKHFKELISANLNEIALLYINSINKQTLSKRDLFILGNMAYVASDYKMASDIMSNNFSSSLDDFDYSDKSNEKTTSWKLTYPLAFWNDVLSASKALNVDPFWILSIMRAESNYNPRAESGVGAVGLMQIMSYTGAKIAENINKKDFNISSLRNPPEAIAFGAWYLKSLLTYYRGNYILATAAYNAGPNAVNRWIKDNKDSTIDVFFENIPFLETQKYVARVLSYLDMYYRVQLGISDGYNLEFGESISEISSGINLF